MINFQTTAEEMQTIRKIINRAIKLGTAAGVKVRAMDLDMDITACHCNGCPLNLDKLLAADDFNFSHDVFGISRHINRGTGELMNCFVPRFSQPTAVAAK